MKKIFISLSSILIIGFFGCKKEINTEAVQQEVSTAKPPSPPPPTSILQWQKFYGSSVHDRGESITKTLDGTGYILTATTLGNDRDVSDSHGGADAWVVKIDLNGNLLWQKAFGGTAGDYAYDISPTADGGYILCGASTSTDGDLSELTNHGGTDLWVVKLSASGDMEWQKLLGGSGEERSGSVIQASDGSYLISGYTNSTNGDIILNHGDYDVWMINLSSTGELLWQKTYGGSLYDAAGGNINSNILSQSDGFLLMAASASTNGDLSALTNHGGQDTWILKIDISGNLLWSKTYGGSGGEGDGTIYPFDGGYLFSTTTTSNNGDVLGNHGYADTWVVKIDATGNKLWQKCFGGTDMDNARIIDIDANGKIVLVGYSFSKNGDIPRTKADEDLWVLRLDADGNKLYSDVITGGDMANSAVPTNDGMYITSGRGNNDVWTVKFKF